MCRCCCEALGQYPRRAELRSDRAKVIDACKTLDRLMTAPLRDLPRRVALSLPTQCAVCRGWDRERVCAECIARFVSPLARCTRCALPVSADVALCGACLSEPPPFEQCVAAVSYAYPWDALIARFKFDQALDLAGALAERLAQAVSQTGGPLPHWVLPAPLAEARMRERGFNQAWELARRVARRLGCRADARLLLRVKHSPAQLALPRAERAANVRGAYLVEPRRVAELRGADVALVDDVLTTGATAAEAARTLLQAGAARVRVWVFARTPAP